MPNWCIGRAIKPPASAVLALYMGGYYYLLHVTLLEKSTVLLVTGLVLLGARWSILNHVMPQEHADA